MDISGYLEALTVSDGLFKDVKFYITGEVKPGVLKLLTDGGAKQVAHITDYVTHLITGEDPSEDEIGEVRDIYEKPVVTQKWVALSVKCGKQLPWEGFSPDTSQFFSGVVACLSKLGLADSQAIWGMITYHGGQCTLQLNSSCTHLIISKPEGDKYVKALENEEVINIVTPDWVPECIEEGKRLDEVDYHPRLLRQPRSQGMPKSSESSTSRERKKKLIYHQKTEVIKPKEEKKKEPVPVKSLFDDVHFSDEEEDQISKGTTLLDQINTPHSWKQQSTKPTVTTQLTPTTVSVTSAQKEKPPTPSVTQPASSSIVTPLPSVDELFPPDSPSSKDSLGDVLQEVAEDLPIESETPPGSQETLVFPPATSASTPEEVLSTSGPEQPPKTTPPLEEENRIQESSLPPGFPRNQNQLLNNTSAVPVSVPTPTPGSAPSSQNASPRTTPPVASQTTTPLMTRASTPNLPQSPAPNIARATPPGAAPLPSLNSRETPPFTSSSTHPINSHVAAPPMPSRTTPPNVSRGTPPNVAPLVQSAASRATPPGVLGLGPRAPAMPPTIAGPTIRGSIVAQGAPGAVPSPSLASTVPQQVHTVAIPGAVVRLPQGVTPHQLQMMTPNERQNFLQSLHQKQLQEQQARGKPRAGKPPGPQYKQGMRFAPPGVHGQPTPAAPGTPAPGTPVSTWAGTNQGGAVVRPLMTTGTSGAVAVTYPSNQLRTQTAGTAQPTTTGSPGEGVQPGWPAQGQQQYPGGQPPPGTRVIVGQAAWQQQQQQPPQAQQQQQQQQPQQPPQPQPQQQQLGIRPQNPPAPGQQPAAHGLLPQHMQQLQLQIQQLCQNFPHLSHQDASQLIQRIPAHFRHIQQLDNAQRSDYLGQLDSKERQVVTYFILRKQQQQIYQRQQLLQQQHQQQQQKVGTPQQSPHAWQQQQQPGQQPSQPQGVQGSQYPPMSPHGRPIPGRPLPQGFAAVQPGGVVSPGQGSPHMVAGGQLTPQQQLTPHVSPLASPHGHSPIQRGDGAVIGHAAVMQGSPVPPNLVSQQNLANHHKTKTALAMHVTSRLAGGVHQGGVIPQGPQVPMEISTHVVQKPPAVPQESVQGPGGEPVMMYPRRALGNITGTVTNNILRPPSQGTPTAAVTGSHGYPRPNPPSHSSSGATPGMAGGAPHYPRPHLVGHDTNIMLPRELCLVGCVFYIADYHGDVTLQTLQTWKILIQQHGGEVVPLYDSARVTHLLCKHQKSPVFMQAVRENKRCITIYWLNDVLLRGKMAPPWQAVHLPTPFGDDNKPCKDLIVSISGFENEERSIITLMLRLVGAKYTGCFSRHNNLLVCKKLEGAKVAKAKEWRKPVVNGVWLSEVLLGQNTPPLVYHGTRYQHYLDDPLRIDPSLASHLFNAWKYPISVSKESVEKAKAGREIALRKRKSEIDVDQENKRSRLEPPAPPHLGSISTPHQPQIASGHAQNSANGVHQGSAGGQQAAGFRGPLTVINKELPPEQQRPRILLSSIKNKEDIERKVLELGGFLARTSVEATHLVMGGAIAQRTVKFMCAVSCCSFVVSVQWVLDSHNEAKFIHEHNYIMEMPEFERVFKFSLRETLTTPNRRHLFAGRTFYLTPSVVPGRTWLKEIIECAGGTVDNKLRSVKDVKERNRNGSYQYFIIAAVADSHLVRDFLRDELPVYNAEFVLGSILRQHIDTNMAKYWDED